MWLTVNGIFKVSLVLSRLSFSVQTTLLSSSYSQHLLFKKLLILCMNYSGSFSWRYSDGKTDYYHWLYEGLIVSNLPWSHSTSRQNTKIFKLLQEFRPRGTRWGTSVAPPPTWTSPSPSRYAGEPSTTSVTSSSPASSSPAWPCSASPFPRTLGRNSPSVRGLSVLSARTELTVNVNCWSISRSAQNTKGIKWHHRISALKYAQQRRIEVKLELRT